MAGAQCFLLLVVTVAVLALALPTHGRPEDPVLVSVASPAVGVAAEEPRETFTNGFPPSFAQNLPTQEFMGDFSNSPAAKEGSTGFISGRPDNFPQFASIGGFGPMTDVDTGNVDGTFMQEIDFPAVSIRELNERDPQFSPQDFPQQDNNIAFPSHPPAPPPAPPPPPPSAPPHAPNLIPHHQHLQQRPHLRGPPHQRLPGRPFKRPIKRPTGGPITLPGRGPPRVPRRHPRFHNTQRHAKQLDVGVEEPSAPEDPDIKATTRNRREAAEPDPTDPANIPHKRVHRVQTESNVPHSRSPREFLETEESGHGAHSETPLHFRPASGFQFPTFQLGRRAPASPRGRSSRFQSATRIPSRFTSNLRTEPKSVQEDELISPESQRFYPTFNGRHSPFSPSRQPFFPSPVLPSRVPGHRGGRFIPHSPGHHFDGTGPRDFHNSFHSGPPGGREAFHKPDFSFTSSRRPFHREQEFENHDNSLLGSGNFEVLSGGTFYDNNDPNLHHQEYDHLLGDEYGTFPGVQSQPHTNNYVDDFFSNFRDFSEFAARKSDEGESTTFLDNTEFFSRGFASEQVPRQVAAESKHSDKASGVGVKEGNSTQNPNNNNNQTTTKITPDKNLKVDSSSTATKTAAASPPTHTTTTTTKPLKHKQPKNIQDVLDEVDPRPSDYTASFITVDEKDPMIAMF